MLNLVNLTEFMSLHLKKHFFFIFWSIFFQIQDTKINVEVSSSHVFGYTIENHLSSGEEFDEVEDEDTDDNDVMKL